jgi:hypothetical protein
MSNEKSHTNDNIGAINLTFQHINSHVYTFCYFLYQRTTRRRSLKNYRVNVYGNSSFILDILISVSA